MVCGIVWCSGLVVTRGKAQSRRENSSASILKISITKKKIDNTLPEVRTAVSAKTTIVRPNLVYLLIHIEAALRAVPEKNVSSSGWPLVL